MPRGKRPAPPRQTISDRISQFSGRIEETAPEWLDGFIERRRVLLERFHEVDAEGNYVCTVAEQTRMHAAITVAEAELFKFAALREQHMRAKGLAPTAANEGTTNVLALNFAPGMSAAERAYAERLFLSAVSGKEVERQPLPAPTVLEAQVA